MGLQITTKRERVIVDHLIDQCVKKFSLIGRQTDTVQKGIEFFPSKFLKKANSLLSWNHTPDSLQNIPSKFNITFLTPMKVQSCNEKQANIGQLQKNIVKNL